MSTTQQAIVFSGGGAYGGYEVGVLKALAERGWAGPQIVTGVSAGAFNAAMLVEAFEGDLLQAAARLEDLWVNRIPDRVFQVRGDPRPLFEFTHSAYLSAAAQWFSDFSSLSLDFGRRVLRMGPGGLMDDRALQLVDVASLISVAPLEALLREIITPEKLRESPLALFIVATNWRTGESQTFTKDDLTDKNAVPILMASAAIPGFFPPRRVGESVYVDGGLVMNTPLKPAIKAGANEIHIIYLDPDIRKMAIEKLQNTFDTLDRVMAINLAFHINADIEKAQQVNRAIELFEEPSGAIPETKMSDLAGIADRWQQLRSERPRRKLKIHRYHPSHDLGGLLGLLRFKKDAIEDLIRKGYQDTMNHNCEESGCKGVGKRAQAAG